MYSGVFSAPLSQSVAISISIHASFVLVVDDISEVIKAIDVLCFCFVSEHSL